MSFALSGELLRTAELARELGESRERMSLAATAAHLGFWEWDVVRDEIWATGEARAPLNAHESRLFNLQRFLDTLHPDDREPTRRLIWNALDGGHEYEAEYRVLAASGDVRRIAARGRVELNARNTPVHVRGVAIDVTDRRNAEQSLRETHAELDRVSRLTAMGKFAAALAHRLLQPLTTIVVNAEICLRSLPDTDDLRDVRTELRGVTEAGRRAAQVIQRNRELFRNKTVRTVPLDINSVIEEARTLAARRLTDSGVGVGVTLATDLPMVVAIASSCSRCS